MLPLCMSVTTRFLFSQGVLNRAAHQTLGPERRNRLDGHAGIGANLLRSAAQHVLVQEFDQFLHFRRAGFPFDPDINVFGIFAKDDDVHALGMFHRRRHALEIAHRTHAGIQIEDLAQRDVERANPAAHGSRQRAFDGNPEIAHGFHGFVGQPLLEFVVCFLAREYFKPGDLALAAIDQLHGGVKHAPRRLPDVASRAIAFDKRNDGPVGNDEFPVRVFESVVRRTEWACRYTMASCLCPSVSCNCNGANGKE